MKRHQSGWSYPELAVVYKLQHREGKVVFVHLFDRFRHHSSYFYRCLRDRGSLPRGKYLIAKDIPSRDRQKGMASKYQGKAVLVTGGGGGLGRKVAENFLNDGANVVVCDINKQLLADFEKDLSTAHPDRTLAVECNITSQDDLDKLFKQAEEKFGTFDIVVNCAGIIDRFTPAGDIELEEWDRVLAVNLTAPTFITKRAVNGFLKSDKKGAIVNIASVASFKGFANGMCLAHELQ